MVRASLPAHSELGVFCLSCMWHPDCVCSCQFFILWRGGAYWWRIKSSPIDSILFKAMFQVLSLISHQLAGSCFFFFLTLSLYIFSFSENFCQQQQYWPSMNMVRLSGGGGVIFPYFLEQNNVCQCLGTRYYWSERVVISWIWGSVVGKEGARWVSAPAPGFSPWCLFTIVSIWGGCCSAGFSHVIWRNNRETWSSF